MPILILLMAAISPDFPGDTPDVKYCDQIEVNSVYDSDGRLWLKQVIFWRWDDRCGWLADGWQLSSSGRIRSTPRGYRWESRTATVETPQVTQTWTQVDRERENAEQHPGCRRALRPGFFPR